MDIYTLNTKFLATIEQMTIHIDNCNDLELQMGDAFFEVVQFRISFVSSEERNGN